MNLEELFYEYATVEGKYQDENGDYDIGLSKDKFIELMEDLVSKIKKEEKIKMQSLWADKMLIIDEEEEEKVINRRKLINSLKKLNNM